MLNGSGGACAVGAFCCVDLIKQERRSISPNAQVAKMKLHGEPVALCISRPNPSQVLVSFREGPPALLDLSQNSSTPVPCVPSGQSPLRQGSL